MYALTVVRCLHIYDRNVWSHRQAHDSRNSQTRVRNKVLGSVEFFIYCFAAALHQIGQVLCDAIGGVLHHPHGYSDLGALQPAAYYAFGCCRANGRLGRI